MKKLEEWLDKVLIELDKEYDHNMKIAMMLEKERSYSASERFYHYACGLSHAIAKIVEASENKEVRT